MRRFKSLFLLTIFLGLALFVYAFLIEPRSLRVTQVSLPIEGLDEPVRVGVMTDLHINGLHVPPERVTRIVARMNAAAPDFVLLPGDFVDGHALRHDTSEAFRADLDAGLSALSGLQAPAFATIGNHDVWHNVRYMTRTLRAAGITVLDNASTDHGPFCLVGLADAMTATPDVAAYDACDPDRIPLAFTHSPDAWPVVRADTALVIAGHTHGGQVNLPFIGRRVNAVQLGPAHSYGLSEINGVTYYVSSGIGTSILPIRFRSPPEIVILTLQPTTP